MPYDYQMEKFGNARRALMVPHYGDEAKGIAASFHECQRGLHELNIDSLPEESWKEHIRTVMRFVDTTGLEDPAGKGTWTIRAESMTDEEKAEYASAVDELASYFSMQFWSGDK